MAQHGRCLGRQAARVKHTRRDRILNIVVQKCDVVRAAHNTTLRCACPGAGRVGHNAVAHLPGQVQALPVPLEKIHNAQALPVMGKAPRAKPVKGALTRMAKGSVAQIMPKGNSLGQVLIQPQRAGDRARDLGHLKRVGQPGAVVVPLRREKYLCFLLQPAEGLAVENTIPVALEAGPDRVLRQRQAAAQTVRTQGRAAAQGLPFNGLGLFTDCHSAPPFPDPLSINTTKVWETLFFCGDFFEIFSRLQGAASPTPRGPMQAAAIQNGAYCGLEISTSAPPRVSSFSAVQSAPSCPAGIRQQRVTASSKTGSSSLVSAAAMMRWACSNWA